MEQLFHRAKVRARISENPLGDVLQQYVGYLERRGHKLSSLHQYVFAVEHFGNWLRHGVISHESVERFVVHLRTCRCSKPASRTIHCVRASLNRLLEMRGISRSEPRVLPAVGRLLGEYASHLLGTAGLAASTVHYRVFHARNLLQHFGVRRRSQLRHLGPAKLADYVARWSRTRKPGSGQQLASSTRSFVRFLLFKGLVPRDLAPAIPSFANWRLARLPAVVERNELERLLLAVDLTTPLGLRDRAALLCLIDLGLRASEVVAITCTGIDLRNRVLRLSNAKERRVADLPMTKRLAHAIDEYLRRGRPPTVSPELFLIHRAPIGQPLKPIGIRGIVVRHAALAGLSGSIRPKTSVSPALGVKNRRHSVRATRGREGASAPEAGRGYLGSKLGFSSLGQTPS